MSNQPQRKKKKSTGKGVGVLALLLILLPQLLDSLDEIDLGRVFRRLARGGLEGLLPVVLVILGIVIVIIAVASGTAKQRREQMNSSAGRTSAAVRRPDPRTRSFTEPEAPCIVCDHTGEDHFQRDKAKRIAQLEEWLKIGLIDREEYRVLKDRYERDI